MKRGEVWLCTVDPTVGAEIRKTRPCLIVSPDDLNQRLQTVLVSPLTSAGRASPFRVKVMFQRTAGLILPDQTRALARERLVRRLGRIDDAALDATLAILRQMFES